MELSKIMATSLPELQNSTELPEPDEVQPPDPEQEVLMLEDRLPLWFRTRPAIMGFAICIGVVFVFFNARRLYHSDVWGHLAYGRLIVAERSIPATEPLLVMAEGVPLVDTAWLSQVIGYGTWQAAGTAGISFLYGALVALAFGLMIHAVHRRTQSVFWPLAAGMVFLLIDWQQLMIARPQVAGLTCFIILLNRTQSRSWSKSSLWLIPLMFMLWANLHGSFICGLLLLAALAAGGFIDVWRHSGRLGLALRSKAFVRPLVLLELSAVATLLNPYGFKLYPVVLTFSQNANLNNLIEWDPLNLRMMQGMSAAAATLVLFAVYRLSPRRIPAGEVLMLAGFGVLAMWTSRMIVWWAPVAAYAIALNGQAAWRVSSLRSRWTGKSPAELKATRFAEDEAVYRSLWSVCTIGIAFICISLTPLFLQLKTGEARDLEQAVSKQTPIGAVEYLNSQEDLPRGPIFNSFGQGDYVMFAGKNLNPFVSSHVHQIPREVWRAHIDISQARSDAAETLARHGINIMLLDTTADSRLLDASRRSPEWREVYSDDRSAVFFRREPI